MRFVFDDKMINYQYILLNCSQLIKKKVVLLPYKICKQSLINIDFIGSVYEHYEHYDNETTVLKRLY